MRNFKFRSNALLALCHNRWPCRPRWPIPLMIIAAGGLYTDLHLKPATPYSDSARTQAIQLPLALPSAETHPHHPARSSVRREGLVALAREPDTVNRVFQHASEFSVDAEITGGSSAETPTTATGRATAASAKRRFEHQIQSGDSLARIFKDWKLPPLLLHRILNSGKPAKQLDHIKPGQMLRVRVDAKGQFTDLAYHIDPATKLEVTRDGDRLSAALVKRDIEVRDNEVSGVIESSLFESAQKAGLSDVLTMQLAKIFGWDIDFALEIRPGDRFSVVFSEEWLEGNKLAGGTILAAEFVNQGKVYRAVRFEDSSGKADYYTPDGKRMHKTFLRTPVKFTRISSGFTKRRWHPMLKKWRSHKGVDYAAPTGTPVTAAGDGKVSFVGRKGGYGKVVILQHQDKFSTVYGHLSRFAKRLKRGKQVRQGQLIGYVGKTGLASGPHLHYEFRVNGTHRNPLKVTFLPAAPIGKNYLPAFRKACRPLLAKLDTLNRTLVADAL